MKRFEGEKRITLDQLTLSDAELTSLDGLMQFYRTNPRGDCTTTDTITITQLRDGKAVTTEQFSDGSCRGRQQSGVMPFLQIIQELESE